MELEYVKSSCCHTGGCAEVSLTQEGVVHLRNSTQVDAEGNHVGPKVAFTDEQWQHFLLAVARGEFSRD